MPEHIVIASTGGWDSPSTRLRLGPLARESPWRVEVLSARSLPTPPQVAAIAAAGGPGAVLILQRVLPAPPEMSVLRARYDRVVFDIDDAIYAVPPSVNGSRPMQTAKQAGRLVARGFPRASARRRPLIRTLRAVDACVVGNSILARFARPHCHHVVEIPTTIAPLEEVPKRDVEPTLVWVGIADNLQYLSLIADPLARLRKETKFRFTVVSSRPWLEAPIPTDFVQWSEDSERAALLGAAIGVAPLTDDPWTRGKCALRAILYGGHALPTVASPVGVTEEVLVDGETGVLARTNAEWIQALRRLVGDLGRAMEMGQRAWERIRATYSHEVALRTWLDLLQDRVPPRRVSHIRRGIEL
jgi:glycosyltransferase involved in cell wall biosynthesis